MTPGTQEPIWQQGGWIYPHEPRLVDDLGMRIAWDAVWDSPPPITTNGLLDEYCVLAAATDEEMLAFVEMFGVPEVGIPSNAKGSPIEVVARRASIRTSDLRLHARAVSAARRVGANLTERRPGDLRDWKTCLNWLPVNHGGLPLWFKDPSEGVSGDWKRERAAFAELLTEALDGAGVRIGVQWVGRRGLAIDPRCTSFVGVILTLLAREIGADGAFRCDSCGREVFRARAPQPGHGVYCDRPECKREQRRLNQAKRRARAAATKEGQ